MISAFKDCITLSWTPPSHTGGTNILGYNLEKCKKGSNVWSLVHPPEEPINSLLFPLSNFTISLLANNIFIIMPLFIFSQFYCLLQARNMLVKMLSRAWSMSFEFLLSTYLELVNQAHHQSLCLLEILKVIQINLLNRLKSIKQSSLLQRHTIKLLRMYSFLCTSFYLRKFSKIALTFSFVSASGM